MKGECIEYKDNRKIAIASEDGKVYTLENSRFIIEKVKVDGCIFTDETEKCDYLMNVYDKGEFEKSIFIELKGSDVNKGLNQLWSTFDNLKKETIKKEIWFRLCVGSKNSVPKSAKQNSLYKKLFIASAGNIRIGKSLTDKI